MHPFTAIKASLRQARLDRGEISGSLGDLGTFLPLLVGMSARCGLDFGVALFFAGLFNVLTGFVFTIPLAVQPMKAIATIGITEGLRAPEILAAGATVSAVILLLALTGLLGWMARVFPRPVVRGLQLSLGLSLIAKGLQMAAGTGTWVAPDSYLTAILCGLLVMAGIAAERFPAALVLFVVGLVLAVVRDPAVLGTLEVSFTVPGWSPPSPGDFASAFPHAALPQIPLTLLNSVIAVSALSVDLFPERPANPRRVGVAVGVMNLAAAWFGGMPMCHGAGGLAGQHRFGARTNGSILFLGAAKMLLALLFGSSLMGLCAAFPASVLGVMLGVSGLELALVTRGETGREDATVVLVTAGACLGLGNIALGFAVGLALAWLLALRRRRG